MLQVIRRHPMNISDTLLITENGFGLILEQGKAHRGKLNEKNNFIIDDSVIVA